MAESTSSIWRPRRANAAITFALAALVASGAACRRSRGQSTAPNASSAPFDTHDVRCVERPEGCVFCEGRGPTSPLVDPDALPASLCDPKDPGTCVDFCTSLTPECAVPWRGGASCLLPSEFEFRRELFRRDTADRAEALIQGRVSDEAGHRVEGAQIRVWFQGTAIVDDASGKDGGFHLKLPAGPWSYSVRVSHPGLATELTELRIDRGGTLSRNFRLPPETIERGRVTDGAGGPVAGATVHALRTADDPIDAAEAQTAEDGNFSLGGLDAKRYTLRASKFGWLPVTLKTPVTVPGPRVTFKLTRTGVIRGRVLDADGDGQPGATVVALASGGLGEAGSPVIWKVDTNGKFAQDRFQPGTYYLWARHGEMLLYPPEKIEIAADDLDAEVELKLSHRGARVRGAVVARAGTPVEPEERTVLFGRSPLALPRKAVGEIDHAGKFVVSGLLPGRYELSVRVGARVLPIVSGPREVEVPIEPGVSVDLPEPVVVRPQPEE
ncbi:MAG TPA: carboxypeptidase-like regulatory domain-containing protein [Polyangia bacterium]|nr:carboxypeptidase-like regulatory domain-containing protein [Polyangia bacterium]